MKCIFILLTLFITENIFAQNDTLKKLTVSGYGEVYYSFDFSKPENHEKPNFLFNHKRHDEINVNLIFGKVNYLDNKFRVNIGLMAGNYSQYNLNTEPVWAQFFYESTIGLKLSNKNNLWLDAGIFPSHIGFESAVSADCWTLTRSLLAENSPYYETGLKLSYTSKNEQLFLSALYLNGWQKIRKPDFIQQPSFGSQFTYKPSSKLTLNYSNFLGTDKPDSLKSFRHFHNFYFQFEPTQKFGIIAGLDVGFENTIRNNYSSWYSPVLILRIRINEMTVVAVRGEYYNDEREVIINTGTPNGFQTYGLSTNIDFELNDKMKVRVEGKMYDSKDKIFTNNTSHSNYSLTTNLTFKL